MFFKIPALLLVGLISANLVSGRPIYQYADDSYNALDASETLPNSVEKIVDFDYAFNDYEGNSQSRREHIEGGKQSGEYRTLLADGHLQIVTYESGGEHGHMAKVEIVP